MTGKTSGYIDLERAVSSIVVGARHRTDLGDVQSLADSIQREGLLQPLTVTLDGALVCGARRLAAIKLLGWRTVSVWVRSGISDRLGHLLAEQDDNMLHKALSPVEAADLYREIKVLLAEDAARNQEATQFSRDNQPGTDGVGNFPTPSEPVGRVSEQAAEMIPGSASYKTLDKIEYLRQIADDPARPAAVRAQAAEAIAGIDAGGPVHPAYERIREAADAAQPDAAELQELAQEALARARGSAETDCPATPAGEPVVEAWPVRSFVATWGELADWWTHFDARTLAASLTDEQLTAFFDTVAGTTRFADELRAAAEQPAPTTRGHLRAI